MAYKDKIITQYISKMPVAMCEWKYESFLNVQCEDKATNIQRNEAIIINYFLACTSISSEEPNKNLRQVV